MNETGLFFYLNSENNIWFARRLEFFHMRVFLLCVLNVFTSDTMSIIVDHDY